MTTVLDDVIRTAQRAVDMFHDRADGGLDFSEDSLAIVESMLDEAAPHVAQMAPAEVAGLVRLLGCYVLEVARKAHGGEYAWIDETKGPVLVVGEPATHIAIATWNKVRGRLHGDPGDNIPFFYRGFSDQARARPAGKRMLFV